MSTYEITLLPEDRLSEIIPLLQRCREKPYRFLSNTISDELDSFWIKEITELVENGQGKIFVAVQENQLLGLLVYSALPWDTRVLGYQMGAVRHLVVDPSNDSRGKITQYLLDYLSQWALSKGIEFLLCKAYTDDIVTIHALEQQRYYLVDTLLDYVYDSQRNPLNVVSTPPKSADISIRLAEASDQDALIELASKSFQGHFGRFHADEFISEQQATAVYEEWIKSSCSGYADWIVVAEVNHLIAGFSIWKKPTPNEQALSIPVGHYSIAATDPTFAGRGLFGMLTYAGMQLLDGLCYCIEGPTHINNYPVQRGYTKLSWRIVDARHSFHKWLKR